MLITDHVVSDGNRMWREVNPSLTQPSTVFQLLTVRHKSQRTVYNHETTTTCSQLSGSAISRAAVKKSHFLSRHLSLKWVPSTQ